MVDPQRTSFRPRWWKAGSARDNPLSETPTTGFEPHRAPRIPTRILPTHGGSYLSASTLKDTIDCTQRILRYVSYEVVHGVQPEFGDLRSAEESVLELAQLNVEPFEEGSFVIPAVMSEDEVLIGNVSYRSQQVLDRFAEVITNIGNAKFPTSIGLVNAIEELGKITRREADRIEYYPTVSYQFESPTLTVDEDYIRIVSRSREERQNPSIRPDHVRGVITAVDLVKGTFNLRLMDRTSVRGRYEAFIAEQMARALNREVEISGVVESINNRDSFVRAFSLRFLDD